MKHFFQPKSFYATICRGKFRPSLEQLEDRVQPSVSGFRPIDETGNNIAISTLGTAGTDLLRVSPAAYADGVQSPSLANNPGARVLSDLLNNQAAPSNPTVDVNTIDAASLSDFGYAWGQFIDHDMDLTPTRSGELLSIPADPNDPSQMGAQTFERSTFDPSTGTGPSNPRQQVNAVTSFLDLSQVYGSSARWPTRCARTAAACSRPVLATCCPTTTAPTSRRRNWLSSTWPTIPEPSITSNLFVTGDVRGNENVELTALQTLFVRNHNRIATELQQKHPGWTDEQLYQEARKLNIADYQEITYNAYLPDLLGQNALKSVYRLQGQRRSGHRHRIFHRGFPVRPQPC